MCTTLIDILLIEEAIFLSGCGFVLLQHADSDIIIIFKMPRYVHTTLDGFLSRNHPSVTDMYGACLHGGGRRLGIKVKQR